MLPATRPIALAQDAAAALPSRIGTLAEIAPVLAQRATWWQRAATTAYCEHNRGRPVDRRPGWRTAAPLSSSALSLAGRVVDEDLIAACRVERVVLRLGLAGRGPPVAVFSVNDLGSGVARSGYRPASRRPR